jgi:hypothetical protein
MWRSCLIVAFMISSALAQEQGTAYDALRVVGTQIDRRLVSRVISVRGTNGDPQPETWTVRVADRAAVGGVREIEVSGGQIVEQRTPVGEGVSAGATINTARLNLDSSGAFSVASYTADKSHVTFALVNYTLRTDTRGNPVWLVTLQDERRQPVGTIHIGANKGNVTRVEGMFRGRNMTEVVQDAPPRRGTGRSRGDEDETEEVESGDGDDNVVKAEIKRLFRRTKRDAERLFERVERSFDDFFRRG